MPHWKPAPRYRQADAILKKAARRAQAARDEKRSTCENNNGPVGAGLVAVWVVAAWSGGEERVGPWLARLLGGAGHVSLVAIVFFKDHGKTSESELEQAIDTYYAMRRNLAIEIENDASHFNSLFEGLAMPDPKNGGVKPTDADDFDGTCAIGERWTVVGNSAAVGAADA